jgi:hypothetical protein
MTVPGIGVATVLAYVSRVEDPALTNPLIFADLGLGAIRLVCVDGSPRDGWERRHEASKLRGWAF